MFSLNLNAFVLTKMQGQNISTLYDDDPHELEIWIIWIFSEEIVLQRAYSLALLYYSEENSEMKMFIYPRDSDTKIVYTRQTFWLEQQHNIK